MACRQAADCLEKLLLLLEKTFGFTRVTYLMAYCIYTGASVMTHDVKAGDVTAGRKMQTFLRALQQGISTCPLLQRSLDIITNSLHADVAPAATAQTSFNDITANYLPAFPYLDPTVRHDLESQPTTFTGMELDAFSFLDSFPENNIDIATGAWYLPP